VVAWVPGQGFLSSPGSGVGQKWLGTIREIERFYNSKYVGWSEDINTVRTAQFVEDPKPKRKKPKMGAFYRNNNTSEIYYQDKPGQPLFLIRQYPEWAAYAANGNNFAGMGQSDIDKIIKLYGVSNAK
jgi:hypothetical protein